MEADGATCPFTTGLFCIPNFRPLKGAVEASVQHCADGWVIKNLGVMWREKGLQIDGHIVFARQSSFGVGVWVEDALSGNES